MKKEISTHRERSQEFSRSTYAGARYLGGVEAGKTIAALLQDAATDVQRVFSLDKGGEVGLSTGLGGGAIGEER